MKGFWKALLPLVAVLLVVGGWKVHRERGRAAAEGVTQREKLVVGYLPVTCHLTCPVLNYASKTNPLVQFESQRFTEFPPIAEAIKAGRLEASFMIVPLAMKLREQGVPVKLVYLGHRDGSTLVVRKDDPARNAGDLKGKTIALPSLYSNQYLVLRHLLKQHGVSHEEVKFSFLPPPEMPLALANKAIDAYFVGEPHPARAELDGTGRVLAMAKDIWPNFISCGLVVHENLIRNRPELVRELVRGIAGSGAWAETHRKEAAVVAAPYYRQKPELLEYVLTHPTDRVRYVDLAPSTAELQKIADMALQSEILQKPADVSALLDTSFVPEQVVPIEMPAAYAYDRKE